MGTEAISLALGALMTDAGPPWIAVQVPPQDSGTGKSLPSSFLTLCTMATLCTTWLSVYSVILQLKHYYKPSLQRYVVRILVMYVTLQVPDVPTNVSGLCCMQWHQQFRYFRCS